MNMKITIMNGMTMKMMDYYNNYRYHWNLNQISSSVYGNKLRNQTYEK